MLFFGFFIGACLKIKKLRYSKSMFTMEFSYVNIGAINRVQFICAFIGNKVEVYLLATMGTNQLFNVSLNI